MSSSMNLFQLTQGFGLVHLYNSERLNALANATLKANYN